MICLFKLIIFPFKNLPSNKHSNYIKLIYNWSNSFVLEFYVDCDGTAGFINVDDFETTSYNDTRNGNYLSPIGSYIEAGWRRSGGSYGFFN